MKNIQVIVIQEPSNQPVAMTGLLAKLTQRGHSVKNAEDLMALYNGSHNSYKLADAVLKMGHGATIRHSPVTLAIIGGSRRLLAQLRTHKIGIEWVSASLQYSDYSGEADFVVPYEVEQAGPTAVDTYLRKCHEDALFYEQFQKDFKVSNDSAGYTMNHALRNILIGTANTEAWLTLIQKRICKRNTEEASYVAALIWEALLSTTDGQAFYKYAGADCLHGKCREGHLTCGKPFSKDILTACNPAAAFIYSTWPNIERK